MKRVLTGFFMDGRAGGIDLYLLNMLEALKGTDVQIDFLTNKIDTKLQKTLWTYHSELYQIDRLKHPVKQYQQVRNYIQKNHYDVVYLNVSTAIDCVAAIAAKRAGVEKIILHSHSNGNDCESKGKRFCFNILHYLCKSFFYHMGTNFYGCSMKAGEWMFPKKIVHSERFSVIYNAISNKKFLYDGTIRKKVRSGLGLENSFVIGNVGNFCYSKNHIFLIKVFQQLLLKEPKAKLVLVGDGRLYNDIKMLAKELKIEENIYFLGRRDDVNELMQGMDVFAIPSNFEGLSIVGIEAQYAGLPCVISDKLPEEVIISEDCNIIPLSKGVSEWAAQILEYRDKKRCSAKLRDTAQLYSLERQNPQFLDLLGIRSDKGAGNDERNGK